MDFKDKIIHKLDALNQYLEELDEIMPCDEEDLLLTSLYAEPVKRLLS